MANENLIHEIIINGVTITNYSEYGFIHRKTYEEEPIRTNGVIVNLNHYKTFLTPQLTFSFKYMDIDAYRTLMSLITATNEFDVICYDAINDIQLQAKMYFEPKEMAQLLILTKGQSLETQLTTLGVLDETFSLIGTNADINLLQILFDGNGGTLTGDSPNSEGLYGEYFQMPNSDVFENTGYLIDNFNTKADGTGIAYNPNYIIQITNALTLYVIWKSNTLYNLSFDYNGATAPVGDEGTANWISSKEVTYNMAIGTLPEPTRTGYTFDGWYWVIPNDNVVNLEASKLSEIDNYPYEANKVCYARWIAD